MTHVKLWSEIAPGTIVTLRRESGERTKAWTASGPFYTISGVACIRVDIGGAVVSYPLERVSLGWKEGPLAPASVRIVDAIRSAPDDRIPFVDRPGSLLIAAIVFSLTLGVVGLIRYAVTEPEPAVEVQP